MAGTSSMTYKMQPTDKITISSFLAGCVSNDFEEDDGNLSRLLFNNSDSGSSANNTNATTTMTVNTEEHEKLSPNCNVTSGLISLPTPRQSGMAASVDAFNKPENNNHHVDEESREDNILDEEELGGMTNCNSHNSALDDLEKAKQFLEKVRSTGNIMASNTEDENSESSSGASSMARRSWSESLSASFLLPFRKPSPAERRCAEPQRGSIGGGYDEKQHEEDMEKARTFIRDMHYSFRVRSSSVRDMFQSARSFCQDDNEDNVVETVCITNFHSEDDEEKQKSKLWRCSDNSSKQRSSYPNAGWIHFRYLWSSILVVLLTLVLALTLAYFSAEADTRREQKGVGGNTDGDAQERGSGFGELTSPDSAYFGMDRSERMHPAHNDEDLLISLLSPISGGLNNLRNRTSFSFNAMNFILYEDSLNIVSVSGDPDDKKRYLGPGVNEVLDRRIQQRFALASLFYATGGVLGKWKATSGSPYPKETNWLMGIHECLWDGVACRMEHDKQRSGADGDTERNDLVEREDDGIDFFPFVVALDLSGRNLSGELPRELSALKRLEKLILRENNLSGPIPAWVGDELPNLRHVFLNNNHFTGFIPHQLASLSFLEQLWLQNNDLQGSMPSEFCTDEGKDDLSDIPLLAADCGGINPKIICTCCSVCEP